MSRTHLRLAAIVVMVAIAVAITLRRSWLATPSPTPAAAPAATVDRDALLRLVNARTDAYNLSNAQAQADFASAVARDVGGAFSAILANVPEATARLTSWETSADLALRLAADRLNGTDTAAPLVANIITPAIGAPCCQATALARQHLDRLRLQLAENNTLYGADLAAMLSGPDLAPALPEDMLEDFGAALADTAGQINSAAFETALAAVSAGADALFIQGGLAAMTRVAAAAAARMAAGSAIGAGCAAADGPMPVGDIIGALLFAGGTAWTTWDLYNARIRLPREIALDLTSKISAYRDNVIRTTLDGGKQALELQNQTAAAVVAQLQQHLQGE